MRSLGANVDDGSCYEMGVGNISGSVFPFAGGEFVYTYNGVAGAHSLWSVDGGEIIAGQGTTEVTVLWGTEDQFGAVYVLETDATGCEGEAVRTVQILNVSAVEDLDLVEAMLMPNPAKGQVSLVWNDLPMHADLQVVLVRHVGSRGQDNIHEWCDGHPIACARSLHGCIHRRAKVTLPLMVK